MMIQIKYIGTLSLTGTIFQFNVGFMIRVHKTIMNEL